MAAQALKFEQNCVVSPRFGWTLRYEWSRRVITQNWGESRLDHPELGGSPIFEGDHLPDYYSNMTLLQDIKPNGHSFHRKLCPNWLKVDRSMGHVLQPCNCTVLHPNRSQKPFTCFYSLCRDILSESLETKYLGVVISSNLLWKKQVNTVSQKAS